MTFPDNIEKWRKTVDDALQAQIDQDPTKNSLIDRVGLTIARLEDIILALIQKESNGNERAQGDSGNSYGLMQLNYGAGTPQFVGFSGSPIELFEPYTNVYFGTAYFLYQLNRYSDANKAILAYNAGSIEMASAGIPINQNYLDDVLSFLSEKKTSSSSPSQSQLSTLSQEDVNNCIYLVDQLNSVYANPSVRYTFLTNEILSILKKSSA